MPCYCSELTMRRAWSQSPRGICSSRRIPRSYSNYLDSITSGILQRLPNACRRIIWPLRPTASPCKGFRELNPHATRCCHYPTDIILLHVMGNPIATPSLVRAWALLHESRHQQLLLFGKASRRSRSGESHSNYNTHIPPPAPLGQLPPQLTRNDLQRQARSEPLVKAGLRPQRVS